MRFFLVLLSGVILFLFLKTATNALSLSKPGCKQNCGNVTIPYPFGVGPGCSLNSSFRVVCENSVPILTSINLEVANISLDTMIVKVKLPISPMKCSSDLKNHSLGKSLVGSPFTVSEISNTLVVLGCHNVVWLRSNKTSTSGGCMAICDANSTDTSCAGVNCCQISIPKGLKGLEFTYRSINTTGINTYGSCGYVFFTENKWIEQDYKTNKRLQQDMLNPFDERMRYAVIVLEWRLNNPAFSPYATTGCFINKQLQRKESNSYYDYTYPRPPSTHCSCVYGFEGNPFLRKGCQDIDECTTLTLNRCRRNGFPCINTIGSYECQYPEFREDNKNKILKKTFTVIGSVLGSLVFFFAAWRFSRTVWKRIKANRKMKYFRRNGGLLLQQHLSGINGGVEKVKLFRSKDLSQATNCFSENRVLGRGGQGTVYKGMLSDGRIVAVKKSKKIKESDIITFINEVVILSQINHRNVVKLLGCCLETEIPLLVYEFIPNGTLYEHIHDRNEEFPLTWDMRLRIAIEVANCLSYLHTEASTSIYHRDIKSTNILLDDRYRAKVSDFGTSRSVEIDQTHLTTQVLGTFGYLDPEYFQSNWFTEKSDVYSFGVVMVELITGEKPVSSERAEMGRSLATHFLCSIEENQLLDILDSRVLREDRKEEILAMAELAQRCLHLQGKKRPTMKEVAVELERIRNSREVTDHIIEEKELSFTHIPDLHDFSNHESNEYEFLTNSSNN